MLKKLALFWLLLVLGGCGPPGAENMQQTGLPAGRSQLGWGIYMVGSDLEDDVRPRNSVPDEEELGEISKRGAGSSDLREMISAYQSFSESEQQSLDLVVAFGGARKKGWQGIKYADLPCLIKDAEDDYFGNADCYLYSDDSPSLSDSQPLAAFLKFLKPRFENKQKRIFELWNHGAAYLGVGYDSRQEAHAMVTLPELKSALQEANSHFDLLGFDACLMASLEVAHTVAPFADYMVASQELEPGHGWDYTQLLDWLKANPQVDIEAFGKAMVDSFIDSPKHAKTKYKTLSLLRLKGIPGLVSGLDQLTQQLPLNQVEQIAQARRKTQEFGVQNRGEVVYSIDLKDWLENLSQVLPNLDTASPLKQFSSMMVYSRADAYVEVAEGLTVFSLNAKMKKEYKEPETFSRNFLNFAENFIQVTSQDQEQPSLNSSEFQTKQANANCQGLCLNIRDNQGLQKVEQMLALVTPERKQLYAIGSRPLKELSNALFQAEPWDGEWFLLCDGDCKSGLSVFPALFFAGYTQQNTQLYRGEVRFNGQDALLYIEKDTRQNVVNSWVVPFISHSGGIPLLAKEQLPLATGDSIQFYFRVIDLEKQSERWELGDSLTFSQAPSWDFAEIEAERVHYVQATDYNHNLSVSPLYAIRKAP